MTHATSPPPADGGRAFARWLEELERRHLADLRFQEVTRALRALSADYVHRRPRLREGALQGRGKRAAFALFYGPLHFLVVSRIARALQVEGLAFDRVIDFGCGTGAAGAAFAQVTGGRPEVIGIDRQGWALEEAAWTYRHFGLRHRVRRGELAQAVRDPKPRTAIVAGYTINELTTDERAELRSTTGRLARRGVALLVVEPIARTLSPWWGEWVRILETASGRADEWRFTDALPDRLRVLDRAAGLDHRELTARSLWVAPRHEG